MATNYPTLSQLKQAVKVAEKLQKLQAQLNAITGGVPLAQLQAAASGQSTRGSKAVEAPVVKRRGRPPGSKAKKTAKKGGMSAEGRARVAEAQKRRWAAFKKKQKKK